MEFQSSRFAARVDRGGAAADARASRTGVAGIARRSRAGARRCERADAVGRGLGYYGLQAAIAECHAVAPSFDDTDWARIVRALRRARDARAVARRAAQPRGRRLDGRRPGRRARDRRRSRATSCADFRPLHAVRAELLERTGRTGCRGRGVPARPPSCRATTPRPIVLRRRAEALAARRELRRAVARSRRAHRGCGSDPGCSRNQC